jgi:hypothetical protein
MSWMLWILTLEYVVAFLLFVGWCLRSCRGFTDVTNSREKPKTQNGSHQTNQFSNIQFPVSLSLNSLQKGSPCALPNFHFALFSLFRSFPLSSHFTCNKTLQLCRPWTIIPQDRRKRLHAFACASVPNFTVLYP